MQGQRTPGNGTALLGAERWFDSSGVREHGSLRGMALSEAFTMRASHANFAVVGLLRRHGNLTGPRRSILA